MIFLLVLAVSGGVSSFVSRAEAFRADEEEQLRIDLKEARARATDFKAHIRRLKSLEENRERFAQESKIIRDRDEAQAERSRVAFIVKRNAQVPDDAIRERLEREFEAEQEREAARMDVVRRNYLSKKRAVAQTIEREASIDENVEFDLKP